ncbi:helix-turn-helix domain-containing protein [Streptomyces sp. NPDC093225]|uniref:helix-turn-helix domain-containing protein n=1 Tax=Streptomyces sp. NPDC093225 TaxID=3366034 RepID=UPI00382FC653
MYEERASRAVPGAVLWTAEPVPGRAAPVLPDGCMDLIWADGGLWVAGPDTRPHTTGDVTAARFAGLRFAPGTLPALLGVPAYELVDRRVPLAELRQVRPGPGFATDPAGALEELAARLAAGAPPPDALTGAVVACLAAGRSVAGTAAAVGLGARQLHRRSLAAFGYGPKTLARVLRLRRALALARSGMPAAAVAHAVGCADQAHLAREVRELAGTTLGAYTAQGVLVPSGANRETPVPSGSRTTA